MNAHEPNHVPGPVPDGLERLILDVPPLLIAGLYLVATS